MLYKKFILSLITLMAILTLVPIQSSATSLPHDISIATGKYHSLVSTEDGRLLAWGDNSKGQIGNGTTIQQNVPVQIMDNIYQVAAGDYTSYALTYSGLLYGWGDNSHGECGLSGGASVQKPSLIMQDVAYIAATKTHAYAVKSNGELYFWGESIYRGQYPFTGEVNYTYQQPNGLAFTRGPIKLMDDVKNIYCNDTCTGIINQDGSLWGWSRYFKASSNLIESRTEKNSNGNTIQFCTWLLTPVKIADSAKTSALMGNGGYYIDKSEVLCTWNGPCNYLPLPDELRTNINNISTNDVTPLFLAANGDLYVFSYSGGLLVGTGTDEHMPTPFNIIARDVKTMKIGEKHAILVKQNGEIWSWGSNEYGQLGNGTGVNYNVPYRITEGVGSENVSGSSNPITIIFDGKKMSFDVDPTISSNRVLAPFRAVFEALGADVSWDGETKSATATKGNTTIIITIDSKTAYINGKPYLLDAAPIAISGRNMIPIRFIGEAMNCYVDYIGSDRIVDIRSEYAYNLFDDAVKKQLISHNVYIEAGQNGSSVYYTASGVLIDPAGIILTNKHVTAGMDWIKTTVNGVTCSQYERIYEDPTLDYAIYRILGSSAQFSAPELGFSSALKEGSELFCCGNPGGVRDQCFRGTVDQNIDNRVKTTLYSEHGSSGSGVYDNSLKLVALIYAFDSLGKTHTIPLSLMKDHIVDAISIYGASQKQKAA